MNATDAYSRRVIRGFRASARLQFLFETFIWTTYRWFLRYAIAAMLVDEKQMIETLVIALHSDVGVDVKSDKVEFLDSFSLVEREL